MLSRNLRHQQHTSTIQVAETDSRSFALWSRGCTHILPAFKTHSEYIASNSKLTSQPQRTTIPPASKQERQRSKHSIRHNSSSYCRSPGRTVSVSYRTSPHILTRNRTLQCQDTDCLNFEEPKLVRISGTNMVSSTTGSVRPMNRTPRSAPMYPVQEAFPQVSRHRVL